MFATKKNPVTLSTAVQSDEALIQAFSSSLSQTDVLINQAVNMGLAQIIDLANSLLQEKYELKNNLELHHNFKNIFSTLLPNLINSYSSLAVEYRETQTVKDNKTPHTILLEQLENIKLILIEIKTALTPQHLKNFLIESTLIEQKTSNIENKEQLLEKEKLENLASNPISVETINKINKQVKSVQDMFVFFERLDSTNAAQGRKNLSLALAVGGALAALALIAISSIAIFGF